jgi:hypothetical protein
MSSGEDAIILCINELDEADVNALSAFALQEIRHLL